MTWDLILQFEYDKWRSVKVHRLLLKVMLSWTSYMFAKGQDQKVASEGRMAAGLLPLIFYQIKNNVTKKIVVYAIPIHWGVDANFMLQHF